MNKSEREKIKILSLHTLSISLLYSLSTKNRQITNTRKTARDAIALGAADAGTWPRRGQRICGIVKKGVKP